MTARAPSGHVDTFCRDHLPPRTLWPEMRYDRAGLAYPARLNCATELLDAMVARGHGDDPIFLFPGGRWTYADLLERSNRIANVLVQDLGVVPGSRVLLRGPNNPMMAACWFAVLKAGGVVVCTMPLLRPREIAYTADRAGVTVALTDVRLEDDCRAGFERTMAGGTRAGARVVCFNSDAPGSLESLMTSRSTAFRNVSTAADDVALIAFTSGTTGKGKGTMHFHRDVLAICDCFPPHVLQPEPHDVFCGSPPFAFTFGLGGLVLFPMRIGASALLLEQASPPLLLQGIREFGATISFTAPTAYRAMLPLLGDGGVPSLRKCVSAGETLPASTFEAWERATGIRIIDGIGSTEMLHIFISARPEAMKAGATGKPVPGYEARVVDDDGEDVPAGTIGRLAVRGPTGCRYLDDVERQQAYVQGGWNITGDSYLVDADGYFVYQARTDDMIISSGHNIAGPEVESVILEHPAVAECGVIGVPDEERGQVVKAFVVLRDGHVAGPDMAKALQDHVKREIAPHKYPRQVEFVAKLPRTATGKLQRYVLREEGA
ncbi:MAG TPA: AMP-binding protein [Gemmatimonadales bacterium]